MVESGERAWQERQRYMLETGQWSTPSVVNTNSDSGFSLPVTLDARLAQEQIWEDAEHQRQLRRQDTEAGQVGALISVLSDFLSRSPRKFDVWTEYGRPKRGLFGFRPIRRPAIIRHPYHVGRLLDSEWIRSGNHWHPITRYTGMWKIHSWERDTGYYGARNEVSVKETASIWLTEDGKVFGTGLRPTVLTQLRPDDFHKVFDGAMDPGMYGSLWFLPQAAAALTRFLK